MLRLHPELLSEGETMSSSQPFFFHVFPRVFQSVPGEIRGSTLSLSFYLQLLLLSPTYTSTYTSGTSGGGNKMLLLLFTISGAM